MISFFSFCAPQEQGAYEPMSELSCPANTMFAIDPLMVFRPVAGAEVTCYWCRKVLRVCDGERTLAQVAELLHLPLNVCLKLITRAQQRNWAEVASHVASHQPSPLWGELLSAIGEENAHILHCAAHMSRCPAGDIPSHEVGNFLIAVELLLPERRRLKLTPELDRLRLHYAS